ncbi:MAG: YhbY family RNA-binding protein [Gammaproteobacteria bacterium]|nr:YhbY family RNA-binding protein [Gammaproteobacteria bacterium]
MAITEQQKKYLRGLGHKIKPTVMIADNGLSESVLQEAESTLAHHELIKVSVRVGDRAARDELIASLCERSGASLIARIGNVALLFRANPEKPRIRLPR